MEQSNQASGEPLGTVEKAIDVLFHLHAQPMPCGVTAIGRALGMPKSSAHRLLAALVRRSLVERDERGRYRPGIGLVALGLGALEREPSLEAARPILEAEARATGETFFLVGARAGRLVVLGKAEGTGFLRAAPRVGAEVPVHATAVGKLYLAFAPEQLAPLEAPLAEFTPRTLTRSEQLAREVASTRKRGWAENREEWIAGLSVFAAPVLVDGRMAAAAAAALPTPRLSALGADAMVQRVVGAAREIAARLEGRSS